MSYSSLQVKYFANLLRQGIELGVGRYRFEIGTQGETMYYRLFRGKGPLGLFRGENLFEIRYDRSKESRRLEVTVHAESITDRIRKAAKELTEGREFAFEIE